MTSTASLDPERKRARFEAIALPFMTALYNAALRLTHAPDDASDLVQETFLRAYRTFEHFAPGTNCKAWLLTILYSVFINQERKARRAVAVPVHELDERLVEAVSTGGQSPEQPLPAVDERWGPEIERALGRLPQPLRAAVLLVDVEQLSYEEAAAALGWPVGTLGSRLFRARKQLFAALEAYARETGYLQRPVRNA